MKRYGGGIEGNQDRVCQGRVFKRDYNVYLSFSLLSPLPSCFHTRSASLLLSLALSVLSVVSRGVIGPSELLPMTRIQHKDY